MKFERWTKKKTEDKVNIWDASSSGKERAGPKVWGGLRPAAKAGGLACGPRGGRSTCEPDQGGGARGWAGAELEPGGGLTSSRGPMMEDWGPGE